MKALVAMLLLPIMGCLMGFTTIHVPPDARIKTSAWCDKILLVEISKVIFTKERIADGLAAREITVEGKVLEVVRGEQKTQTFRFSKNLLRVVDAKVVDARFGAGSAEVYHAAGIDQTGVADCKEGRRYVVNRTGSDNPFPDHVFFVEVAKDNDDWRKEILPRRRMEDEEKPKVK